MTDADRISAFANVDPELADLVVRGARRARVPVKVLRGDCKRGELVKARRWVIARARPRWSYWHIARALNRDHTTIMHHWHAVRGLRAAQ